MEVRASLMMRARPLALLGSLSLLLGCAGVKSNATTTGSGGSGGSGAKGGSGNNTGTGGTTPPPSNCNGACTDFPTTPVIDGSANSTTAAQIFGAAGSGNSSGGPCLFEPEDGTLFPNNWLRPRFSWTAVSGQNLFELRIHAGNQANDLVVYTTNTSWTLDKVTWTNLASHTESTPITATIRGASANGGTPSVGSANSFTIAPVPANGNLVFWSPKGATNAGNTMVVGATKLSGFAVGDEMAEQVLIPANVTTADFQTEDLTLTRRAVQCIGCHTSTPDGDFIGFNDTYPWGGVLASGQAGTLLGTAPTFFGAGGYNAFIQPWLGIQTYSVNHWATGDHVVVAPIGTCSLQPCSSEPSGNDQDQQPGLAWIDLENGAILPSGQSPATGLKGTAWNWIYQPTSGQYAAAPSWSHAPGDDYIVFTMTSNVVSGRLGSGTAHLYKVMYSRSGPQTAMPIMGDGSDLNFAQYYGSLSEDDAFIAFDKIPAAAAAANHTDLNTTDTCNPTPCTPVWSGMYMQPATELSVIPVAGGSAVRLAANDPPNCPGQATSPGINNTWAKWSPQVSTGSDGTVYYWLIFSSWRQGQKDPTTGSPIAQLFATAVTTNELGLVTTYPAIYLWNQDPTISNFTPAWDYFKIPIIIDQP
jgi:hypothetical protein